MHLDFVSGVHTILNNSFPSNDSVTSDRLWIALRRIPFVQESCIIPLGAWRFEQNDLAVDNRYTRADNLANLGVSISDSSPVSMAILQAAQGSNAGPDSSAEADACAPCTRASRGPCLLPRLLSAPGSGRRRMAMLPGCQPQRKDFKPQMAANQWIHLESGTPPRTLHLLCPSPEQYSKVDRRMYRRPELKAQNFTFSRSRPAQEIPTL